MTPEELAEVMVVTGEPRRATLPEVAAWITTRQKIDNAMPIIAEPPLTGAATPLQREMARRIMRLESAANWQRRHNVGTRTVMLQSVQAVPYKEEMHRWMEEYFAAQTAEQWKVIADIVTQGRALGVLQNDVLAGGFVLIRPNRFQHWALTAWRRLWGRR